MILYATLAKGPKLPPDQQLNSTRHFMREINRLGVTGVIDAEGGDPLVHPALMVAKPTAERRFGHKAKAEFVRDYDQRCLAVADSLGKNLTFCGKIALCVHDVREPER